MDDKVREELENIDLPNIKLDGVEQAYGELAELDGVSVEERLAAETVLAFHKHTNNPEKVEKPEEARKAIKGIGYFKKRGTISTELEFLYDQKYLNKLERKTEDRNMRKVFEELEEEEPTKRKDFVEMEKEFTDYLLGRKYA